MSNEAQQQKHYAFNNGQPTGPDVAELQAKFHNLKVGDRIPYESVEEIIGSKWGTSRFKTVTDSWRAREFDRGIVIECIKGEAFVVATSNEITSKTFDVLKQIGRKSKKQRAKLSTIRPASELEKNTVEHHGMLMLAIERDAKRSRTNLIPDTRPAEAPRIAHIQSNT